MKDSIIIKELNRLIKEGNKLKDNLEEAPLSYWSNTIRHNRVYHQQAEKWKVESINFLRLRFGRESDFINDFKRTIEMKYKNGTSYCKNNIGRALGVLEAVLRALKAGLTEDLFYRKEVMVFGDLLNQAYGYLEKNIYLIATVYGRIVLESTIKEFAKSKNVIVDKLKFNQIIIELKKKGIITQPFEHSLRANYSLGSSFHNMEEFKLIKKEQIKFFLDFIRDYVLTLK